MCGRALFIFFCFLLEKIFSCMPQKLTKILSSHHHHHKTNTNSIVIMRAVNAPLTVSKPSTSNTPSQRQSFFFARDDLCVTAWICRFRRLICFSRWCDESFANETGAKSGRRDGKMHEEWHRYFRFVLRF